MGRKKILGYLLIIVSVFFISYSSTKAQQLIEKESTIQSQTIDPEKEPTTQNQTIDPEKVIDESLKLFDWEAIEKAEQQLKDSLPRGIEFNLKDEMNKMLAGRSTLSVENILMYLVKALLGEVATFVKFGARFILIVLLCNLLQALSSSFKSKNTATIGFFVCYMAILLSVIQSFQIMLKLAYEVIDNLGQVMIVCVPTLLAFMASTGFAVSAGTMAPIIISSLSLITYFIKVIVLPCVTSIVVLEVLSAMSETFKVDKLIGLFYKAIKWTLGTLMGVSVGLLGMYRLVMPGVDITVKKAAVKFSTAFIPIVGSTVGGAVDFITQSASLIKNTFSAGVIIWLLILLSIPLIKILSYSLIYHIAGAIIEPLGDKKMANIATKLGKGSQFIMSCVGMVALFCVCSLLICMTISSVGV